ncbi:hypothetical protein [Ruegeria sp. Alg231-54]|uniref:hypothetical protein n=1 Tax=Ruegeria sp. Alg231-54 TaxID=1922221 RepID=UPI000D55F7F2|nr:hypothetical protein [Ruegeria sp. Alg231-54]
MTDVKLLELAFPDQVNRIRQMRKTHHGFGDLCQDFDLLSAELQKPSAISLTAWPSQNNPVTESLEGLIEEIAEHLSEVTRSKVVPKAISEVVPIFTQARTKD